MANAKLSGKKRLAIMREAQPTVFCPALTACYVDLVMIYNAS